MADKPVLSWKAQSNLRRYLRELNDQAPYINITDIQEDLRSLYPDPIDTYLIKKENISDKELGFKSILYILGLTDFAGKIEIVEQTDEYGGHKVGTDFIPEAIMDSKPVADAEPDQIREWQQIERLEVPKTTDFDHAIKIGKYEFWYNKLEGVYAVENTETHEILEHVTLGELKRAVIESDKKIGESIDKLIDWLKSFSFYADEYQAYAPFNMNGIDYDLTISDFGNGRISGAIETYPEGQLVFVTDGSLEKVIKNLIEFVEKNFKKDMKDSKTKIDINDAEIKSLQDMITNAVNDYFYSDEITGEFVTESFRGDYDGYKFFVDVAIEPEEDTTLNANLVTASYRVTPDMVDVYDRTDMIARVTADMLYRTLNANKYTGKFVFREYDKVQYQGYLSFVDTRPAAKYETGDSKKVKDGITYHEYSDPYGTGDHWYYEGEYEIKSDVSGKDVDEEDVWYIPGVGIASREEVFNDYQKNYCRPVVKEEIDKIIASFKENPEYSVYFKGLDEKDLDKYLGNIFFDKTTNTYRDFEYETENPDLIEEAFAKSGYKYIHPDDFDDYIEDKEPEFDDYEYYKELTNND